MKYVFVTGVAGSCWGWPQMYLQDAAPQIVDATDKKPWRQNNAKDMATLHTGSFFGPYNELGENFDALSLYTPETIFSECDRAFDPTDQHMARFIRCHHFAYQLDWIAENLPEVDILLALRNVEIAYDMWHHHGGWDIDYPSYKWYHDDHMLWRQMHIEHKLIQAFVRRHDLPVSDGFTVDWVDDFYPEFAPHVDRSKFSAKWGAAVGQGGHPGLDIKRESLYYAVYRGKSSTPVALVDKTSKDK